MYSVSDTVSTRKREKENTIEILSGWNFKLDRNFWTTLRTTTSYRYSCILLWFHVCSPKHTHSEAAVIWSISPMMMKISLAFFLLLAITVDAGGKLIKCGFFFKWSCLMIKQTVALFVCDQNKNGIAFRLEIVAFVGETLSLRCTVTNSYQQVRFYIIFLTFRQLSKTTNNCILSV